MLGLYGTNETQGPLWLLLTRCDACYERGRITNPFKMGLDDIRALKADMDSKPQEYPKKQETNTDDGWEGPAWSGVSRREAILAQQARKTESDGG